MSTEISKESDREKERKLETVSNKDRDKDKHTCHAYQDLELVQKHGYNPRADDACEQWKGKKNKTNDNIRKDKDKTLGNNC